MPWSGHVRPENGESDVHPGTRGIRPFRRTDEVVVLLGWALALLPRPHLLYAGTHEFLLLLWTAG